MAVAPSPFIIGWLEWLALPELGLPAIKAKIDTGARTSALHAFLIEPFGPAGAPMVRFGVHPIPGRLDVAVFCSAPIADRREVTSSNGERETRYFIRTEVRLGDRSWPIEIGLTNRESMSYRMLLGRQAIREDMMVDAATSFRQPKLSYRLYRAVPRQLAVERRLRIALVARDAGGPFNVRLARAAAARGHVLEPLELDRLTLSFEDDAAVVKLDGGTLAHYDALVPRLGRREGETGAAVVRQLEAMGCITLNPGDAIDRVANRLAAAQALARDRLPQVLNREAGPAVAEIERVLRVLVVGENAVAMTVGARKRFRAASLARHRTERRLAEHAAVALGLGLAAIDVVEHGGRAAICGVSAKPALSRFERICEADVPEEILDALEQRVRRNSRSVQPLVSAG
jgi:glutathione synthase/RimK-type ligase-like ATP-grasp enzyme